MSAVSPDGVKVYAYQAAPDAPLAEVYPDQGPEWLLAMSQRASSIHAAAARISARLGGWRTGAGIAQVRAELDRIESEARRLRALLPEE